MGSGFTGDWDGRRPPVHQPADHEALGALAVKHEGRWNIVCLDEGVRFVAVRCNGSAGAIVLAQTVEELDAQLEESDR